MKLKSNIDLKIHQSDNKDIMDKKNSIKGKISIKESLLDKKNKKAHFTFSKKNILLIPKTVCKTMCGVRRQK